VRKYKDPKMFEMETLNLIVASLFYTTVQYTFILTLNLFFYPRKGIEGIAGFTCA